MNRHMLWTALLAAAGFGFPGGAAAQQDDVRKEAPTVAPTVIVTATRLEESPEESGSSVSVVTAEQIHERQHDEMQEVLRTIPGVNVVRVGTRGGQTTLSIRGGETDHAVVMLDGFQLNQDGGFFDWDRLSTDGIEQVEVVRGAGSAPHGSDALSGTVNMVLRKGHGAPTAYASFEAGSFTRFREKLDLQGQVGKFAFSTVASHFSQRDGRFIHSDLEKENFVGRFDFDFSDDTSVKFDAFQLYDQTELYTNGSGPSFGPEDPDSTADEDVFLTGLEARHRIVKWCEVKLALSRYRQVPKFRDEPDPGDPFGEFRQTSEFIRDTIDGEAIFDVVDASWVKVQALVGFEYERENVHTHARFFDFDVFDHVRTEFKGHRENRGTYVSTVARLWDRATLELSGRLDNNSAFHEARTARVAGSYLHKETGTRLHASWGKGIKEPTFFESFDSQFGAPGLTPEIGRTWDVGIEQKVWDDRVRLDMTYFNNRIDDLIQFRALTLFPLFTGDFVNAGKAQTDGVELSWTIAPIEEITFEGSFTHLNSRVVKTNDPTDPSFAVGERLLRRPDETVSAGITGRPWKRLTLNLSWLHVGGRVDRSFDFLRPAREEVDGYDKFDFATEYRFDFGLRIFGVIENLTGEKYEDALGFPGEQTNFMTGVGYELSF